MNLKKKHLNQKFEKCLSGWKFFLGSLCEVTNERPNFALIAVSHHAHKKLLSLTKVAELIDEFLVSVGKRFVISNNSDA